MSGLELLYSDPGSWFLALGSWLLALCALLTQDNKMKTYLECIPCFYKQALEAAVLAKAPKKIQKRVLDKLSKKMPDIDMKLPPPHMGRVIYDLVKKETKKKDPYKQVKIKSNQLALKLYPHLKKKVEKSRNRLLVAAELACIGNIIDLGVKNSAKVEEEVDQFLKGNFVLNKKHTRAVFSFKEFKKALEKSNSIVYLGDNAGEIVFDKILIEEIRREWLSKKIYFVVRDKPIINDVLKKDAVACGIDKIATVISSGCDSPGTILSICNKDFLKIYRKADIIVSKGQGNFEALSKQKRPIFFLFRAKCPIVAKELNCKLGDVVLKHPE